MYSEVLYFQQRVGVTSENDAPSARATPIVAPFFAVGPGGAPLGRWGSIPMRRADAGARPSPPTSSNRDATSSSPRRVDDEVRHSL